MIFPEMAAKHPRLNAKNYEARQHPRRSEDRPAWLAWGGVNVAVSMLDVSDAGACFVSPRPPSTGRPVKLQVGHGATSLSVEAVVVRCAQRPDGAFDVGVRFVNDPGFAAAYRSSARERKVAG